jgi:hypothetical protein
MGWAVQGSNPGGDEIFRIHPRRPWGPGLIYNGCRVFARVKRPGRGADHPPQSSVEVKEISFFGSTPTTKKKNKRFRIWIYSPSGNLRPVLAWTLPLSFNYLICCDGITVGLGVHRRWWQQTPKRVGAETKIRVDKHSVEHKSWLINGDTLRQVSKVTASETCRADRGRSLEWLSAWRILLEICRQISLSPADQKLTVLARTEFRHMLLNGRGSPQKRNEQ